MQPTAMGIEPVKKNFPTFSHLGTGILLKQKHLSISLNYCFTRVFYIKPKKINTLGEAGQQGNTPFAIASTRPADCQNTLSYSFLAIGYGALCFCHPSDLGYVLPNLPVIVAAPADVITAHIWIQLVSSTGGMGWLPDRCC